MEIIYEKAEKGNTRTMIPKRPATAPAAHIHKGTCASVSSAFHAASGIESAESIAALRLVDRSVQKRWHVGRAIWIVATVPRTSRGNNDTGRVQACESVGGELTSGLKRELALDELHTAESPTLVVGNW